MSMTARSLICLGPHGFHPMAYARWDGVAGGRPTVCVHGLTRNGRDFDFLAERLMLAGPVICPDIAGRGRSEWLADKADYGYPLYCNDVASLIASLGVKEVDYVGTSMGGIIGMLLAAQPGSPIRRLVLNDIGPLLPQAALERLGFYVGKNPHFADIGELEAYLRRVYAPFGPLTDEQWRHLAVHGQRPLDGGGLGLAYDPAIGNAFGGEITDVDLWPIYDRIRCPTLVIRGAVSDLLLPQTAREMTERGPRATVFEVPGAGHAPALMVPDQIAAIEHFLRALTS